jgi:hypothetical protein
MGDMEAHHGRPAAAGIAHIQLVEYAVDGDTGLVLSTKKVKLWVRYGTLV